MTYANDNNFQYVSSTELVSDDKKLKSLLYNLTNLPQTGQVNWIFRLSSDNPKYVNPVQMANSNPIIEGLKIMSGPTGIVMCLMLALIASSSSRLIRRSFYNLFWYLHQACAAIFLSLFCIHGMQGLVTYQTNLKENDPKQCYKYYSQVKFKFQLKKTLTI